VSGVLTARAFAAAAVARASRGERVAVLFGNEKTGLGPEERVLAHDFLRIPMAADQPSVNLAQATQIVAYELLLAALDERARAE
jgi:tRNA (cytidine32/uridine32-2'-O)-methyltransferase